MTAYDYDRQQWVEGEAARRVLLAQCQNDLALYTGPKAAEALRAMGRTETPAETTAMIRGKIAELQQAS